VISAGIGAGHDGVAVEITRRVRAADLVVERFDFLDLLPPGWGATLTRTYARQLAVAPASWGHLLAAAARPWATAATAALCMFAAGKRLLAAIPPDTAAVVSTYPLASQVLGRLRQASLLRCPAIAVMTDPSVHPLCVAPGIDVHLAPNPDASNRIRREFGLPSATIVPIVDPRFRAAHDLAEVRAARTRHGLPVTGPLALVVAGSWGVGDVEATVRDILATGAAVPVVVCGRNAGLRGRLAGTARVIALGWVDDMPSLMRAVDVIVHNAGGLSSLEGMASGIAMISYRCLPGHGTANAGVLLRLGLSAWPRDSATLTQVLVAALRGALGPRQQSAYRELTRAGDATALIRATAQIRAATPLPIAPLPTVQAVP
jgi:UDP-N-acetylglucosamine:LPS N-acetylglucosamine transferase